MGFLDKAKAKAEQATARVKEGVDDVQAKRGLAQSYEKLGEAAYALVESGEITHPSLVAPADEIRGLKARLDEPTADGAPPAAADPTAAGPPPPPAMPV
jgi:hypothetical protein